MNDLEYTLGLDSGPFMTERQKVIGATKTMAQEQTALFSAMDRLSSAQQKGQLERLANYRPEIILQREILGLKQQIAQMEGNTVAKLEAQIALETKQLQLERMIAAERRAGATALHSTTAKVTAEAHKQSGAFTSISNTMGRMVSAGTVLKSALTSIGVGLLAPFAADKIARWFTGVSEEAEKAYGEIETLSDQVAQKSRENMQARLTEGEKLRMLEEEIAILQEKIVAGGSADVEKQKEVWLWRKRQEEAIGEAAALEKKLNEEAAEQRSKDFNEWQKQRDEQAEKDRKRLKENSDAALKLEEDQFEYAQKNRELLDLEAKLKVGTITPEERTQLEILRLKTQQARIHLDLDYLRASLADGWTKEEEKMYVALSRESKELEKQIALKESLIAKGKDQAAVEKNVAEEIGYGTSLLKSFVREWTGWKASIGITGRGNAALSERELQRKLNQLNKDIFSREVTGRTFGDSDFMLQMLKIDRGQLSAEQRLREQTRRNVRAFGEDRAFEMFGGTEQRFRDIIQDGQATTEQRLGDIYELLKTRGIVTVPIGGGPG